MPAFYICALDREKLQVASAGDEFAALIRRNGNTGAFQHLLSASLDYYNDTSGKQYIIYYSYGELINNTSQYATLVEMIGKCDEVMYLKKNAKICL